MELNNLIKNNKKKIRVEEVLDREKEKPHQEVTKDKNLDLVLLSKVLRVVRCLYIED